MNGFITWNLHNHESLGLPINQWIKWHNRGQWELNRERWCKWRQSITSSKSNHWNSSRQAREQGHFFGKAAFTKKQRKTKCGYWIRCRRGIHKVIHRNAGVTDTRTQHRRHGFCKRRTTMMQVLYESCSRSERGIKGKNQKAKDNGSQRRDDVKLSKQQAVNRAARREGIHFWHTSFIFFIFSRWFVTIYPLVSLWKPGIPYPVHGRVLVEIQRPRSLHRKAVIQLNTKKNQHNQS